MSRLNEQIEERLKWKYLTTNHPNYKENRRIALELCEKDPKFYINNFVYTFDPREKKDKDGKKKEQDLPFLLYDFQEDMVDNITESIETKTDTVIEKSREQGATWVLIGLANWGWKFRKWDCLLGSMTADDADTRGDINTLLEKVRYIERFLPNWMKEGIKEGETDKSMIIRSPKNNAILRAEANKAYFGTGSRYRWCLLDEFAKWDKYDDAAWRSLSATTECRIALSTPSDRGRMCKFFELIEMGTKKLTFHWILHPEKNINLYTEREEGKKTFINLNNKEDLKKTMELRKAGIKVGSDWYDYEKIRNNAKDLAQEVDMDYDASLSGAIFKSFNIKKQVIDCKYNPNLPLYHGWDFGIEKTSIIWIQNDGKYDYIIDEYEDTNQDIYSYIEVIRSKPYKEGIHYGDPYSGGKKEVQQLSTISQLLMRQGIRMRLANRVSINDRVNASLIRMKDTFVSSQCPLFLEMVTNWRFKKALRDNDRPLPDKGIHSHMGEAHGYFSVGMRIGSSNIVKSRYS